MAFLHRHTDTYNIRCKQIITRKKNRKRKQVFLVNKVSNYIRWSLLSDNMLFKILLLLLICTETVDEQHKTMAVVFYVAIVIEFELFPQIIMC